MNKIEKTNGRWNFKIDSPQFDDRDGSDELRDLQYDWDKTHEDYEDEEDNPVIIGGAEEVKDYPDEDEINDWFTDPDRELKLRSESEWL